VASTFWLDGRLREILTHFLFVDSRSDASSQIMNKVTGDGFLMVSIGWFVC